MAGWPRLAAVADRHHARYAGHAEVFPAQPDRVGKTVTAKGRLP